MHAAEKLQELVDSLVIPDRRATAGQVDKEAALKALKAILQGGKENIVALVGLLKEPGKGDDSKARYALHALAVHTAGSAADRKLLAAAMASTLEGDHPRAVKGFVVRQLQVVGTGEVAPALGKLLTDEALCEDAAQALLAIREGAASQFRSALPRTTGKSRVTILQALGVLRDASQAEEIRKLLADADRETRLTAAWVLARGGDAASTDALLKLADSDGYERIKATQACLLLAENLLAGGNKKDAARIYAHLQKSRKNPDERHVREAAERGLQRSK